ncbi:MAG: hypothetical protein LLG02_08560 [Pelosinus sp.]|nr:hypothetical protein [Pelosinus sp.]
MTCPKCGKSSPADWILCEECMPNAQTKKSARSRKIPESYQRRKRIRHTFRYITLSITLLTTLMAIFYFECEFYTIPPTDLIPEGATLIIWRNGDISEPFFNSPDGAMSKVSTEDTSLLEVIPTDRTLLELPYSEFLYLQSPLGETQEE